MNIRTFVFNPYLENTMVLNAKGSSKAVIIDPGCMPGAETRALEKMVSDQGLEPVAILLTHGHADHTHGAAALQKKYGIPVYMNTADAFLCENCGFEATPLEDGQILTPGGLDFKVIFTPGHTPGGVCYYCGSRKVLFSGDTLFKGTIGRTDLPGGDYDKLIVSVMEKIMWLDGDVQVFPGHAGSTTIADERTENPFLQPFNEPEENLDDDEVQPVYISR